MAPYSMSPTCDTSPGSTTGVGDTQTGRFGDLEDPKWNGAELWAGQGADLALADHNT